MSRIRVAILCSVLVATAFFSGIAVERYHVFHGEETKPQTHPTCTFIISVDPEAKFIGASASGKDIYTFSYHHKEEADKAILATWDALGKHPPSE